MSQSSEGFHAQIHTRLALLGGPAFLVLWFLGAQVLFFASGGGVNGESEPTAAEYPEAILSNQLGVNGGSTLLVLSAVCLLWFAVGLRNRTRSREQLDLLPSLAIAGVGVLLILQAGLTVGSLRLAELSPEISWSLYELTGTLGFESFTTALLGGVAVAAVGATNRPMFPGWFWWFTLVFAVVLTAGGLLEGLAVTPAGRFSILFGLWVATAGFTLLAGRREPLA